MKWDYEWSLGHLQPDVLVELWDDPAAAAPWIERDFERVVLEGLPVYLRRGSPRIHRELLPAP